MVSGSHLAATTWLRNFAQTHDVTATDDTSSMRAQACKYLSAVIDALQGLQDPCRKFMELRYFKKLTWGQISNYTTYGERQGQNFVSDALIMFAVAFADTLDLRVFKDS